MADIYEAETRVEEFETADGTTGRFVFGADGVVSCTLRDSTGARMVVAAGLDAREALVAASQGLACRAA